MGKQPLVPYLQFLKECEKAFASNDFEARNYTTEVEPGWTENLYDAQTFDGFYAINYTQGRVWEYHFNGVVGEGPTLDEALKNHDKKYSDR